MSERVVELLLHAVRGLAPQEQDEVMAALLDTLLSGGRAGTASPPEPAPPSEPGSAPSTRLSAAPPTRPASPGTAHPPSERMVSGRWLHRMGRVGRPGPAAPVPDDVRADPRAPARQLWSWPTFDESTQISLDSDTELRVLPVRLPVTDYERLRAFSREHGFSMAVIIRTLVERFLDGQVPRAGGGSAAGDPSPPDDVTEPAERSEPADAAEPGAPVGPDEHPEP